MPEPFGAHVPHDRHHDVQALAARRLDQRLEPQVVEDLEHQERDLHRGVERVVRRVDVGDEQVGAFELVPAHRRRVELERRLVPEPRERVGVVAHGVGDVAPGARRRDRDGLDPVRRVRGRVLLEVALAVHAVGRSDQRERPVAQPREHEPRDGAEVVDVRLLRDAERRPQELVRTGDLDAGGCHRGSEAIPPGIEFGFVRGAYALRRRRSGHRVP